MDITELFLSGARDCDEFEEAVDIVIKNSSGRVWLIGGFVYRTIASELYGLSKPEVDLDFIVETPVSRLNLPSGWVVSINKFGNPKFINGSRQIDYVPLGVVHSILERGVDPTIENFLTGVPLSIQSIAYDVQACRVIGDRGIDALYRKVVEVNDLRFALYAAEKKGKSLRQMMQEKADALGFTPIFGDCLYTE